MLKPTFLLQVFSLLFLCLYLLSTLLMVGYEYIKEKFSGQVFKLMLKDFILFFITLKALQVRRLNPKGYDYKIYVRFQKRYILYYFVLWILLFIILFLAAKIYLRAF